MLKGYRTYICLAVAGLALLISFCIHAVRPSAKTINVTIPGTHATVAVADPSAPAVAGPSTTWNLWLEIIAAAGVALATVFRAQVIPSLLASLKSPTALLGLLKQVVNSLGSQQELDEVNQVLKTVSTKITQTTTPASSGP